MILSVKVVSKVVYKLSALKVNNYDYKRRAIEISYSLALEIEEYLESRILWYIIHGQMKK